MRIKFIQDVIDKIRRKKKIAVSPDFSLPTSEDKWGVIIQYADKYECKCFVETGTYLGDTVEKMKTIFYKIYSIELGKSLYENACIRFANDSNVILYCGDSGELLKDILPEIDKKILFWLDGHYSYGITVKGNKNTPIIEELETISKNNQKNHIILIDDARCFGVEDDYPSIEELRKTVLCFFPESDFKVENDIIRIITKQ